MKAMPPTAHMVIREKNENSEHALTMKHCKLLFTMYIKTMAITTLTRVQKYTQAEEEEIY